MKGILLRRVAPYLAVVTACSVFGADLTKAEVRKIQDNSFLLEEAYNQEPGVIQHIQTFQYMKDKTWGYSFTEEWPVPGQTHQLSITVPVSHLEDPEIKASQFGDVLLNYRNQLVSSGPIAFAPRLSLSLPSGDYKKGFGSGALGVQANLPLSIELSDKWVTHWNLGSTFIPSAKSTGGTTADTLGFNYGTSFIYLLSENWNLMLEFAGGSTESVSDDGSKQRTESFFINPGMRFAINLNSGLQIVPGFSFPIGIGPSVGERGALVYLSFEHPMF